MRFILCLNLLCICISCYSQKYSADKNTIGEIVIKNDTIKGNVDLNLNNELVLFKVENRISMYHARQIDAIKIFRPTGGYNLYKSYELDEENRFFFVVSTGKLEVLFRRGILKNKIQNKYYPDYFVRDQNNVVMPIDNSKKFLSVFGKDSKWMELYIKNNYLDLSRVKDIETAFGYYNEQEY